MPTPRFTPQVRSIQPEPRPAEQGGQTITTEIVEVGEGLSGYLIRGFSTPTRAGLILNDGDLVSVLWQQSKPFMILNLQSSKGPGTDEPFGGGPVVEELFIIGDSGKKEVYFRNDKQVTNLKLRIVLGEDPVDVRWGQDMNNFVVVTGKPTADDLTAQSLHPKNFLRTVKRYHVFALTSTVVRKHGLGGKKPTPKRKRIVEPYADQTVLYQMQTTLDHQQNLEGTNVRNEWTLAATPSGGPADAALDTTLNTVVVTNVDGPGAAELDVTNDHKLDEILNGVNTDVSLYYGDVEDFGCDLQGVFFLSVRAKFWKISEPVEGATTNSQNVTVLQQDDITPCEIDVSSESSSLSAGFTAFNEAENVGVRSQGEAQYFVVKFGLPAPTVLWSSMAAKIVMSNVSRAASAFHYFTTFEKFVGTTFDNPFVPPFTPITDVTIDAALTNNCLANPYVPPSTYGLDHFPNGFPFVETLTDEFANGYLSRRMTLIDETRLPFVDSDPLLVGEEASPVTLSFAKAFQTFDPPNNISPGHPANYSQTWNGVGSAVLSFNPGTNERVFGISRIDHVVRTYVPSPTWSYRLRMARILDAGHPKPLPALKPVVAVVVDRLRCTNPTSIPPVFEKQLGFFVFNTKGNMLTLMPFTATDTAETVQDEFANGFKLDDGSEITILSGNRSHVLWTLSTLAERTANVRHIKLSSLATVTGETRAVGDNWPEFEPHRFKILNVDAALYEAREKTPLDVKARRFVDAWDFKTKKPTLNQVASGYPKPTLPGAGMLKDLPPEITPNPDPIGQYHAVNDRAILGGKWDVKDNAIPLV